MSCKRCHRENVVKNGKVRSKQRWLCKDCGCNFVEGDQRSEWRKQSAPRFKALAVLLCSVGLSFRLTARIVQSTHTSVQRWFEALSKQVVLAKPEPEAVKLISLDEMWHFVQKKQKNCGSGKPPLLTVQVRLDCSTWLLVSVIQEPLNAF